MTGYAVGTRFERKVSGHLETNGYVMLRAAGSKGGTKADLLAFKPGQLLMVQCKLDGKLPAVEWDRLVEVAGWVSAVPLLASNGPRGRGVSYMKLLGPKRPRARIQAVEPFQVDEIVGR